MIRPLVFMLCLVVTSTVTAQKKQYLTSAVDGFSKKKTSYITLNDGTEIEGTIKKIKRAKWLFEEIHLIVGDSKKKIAADEIKSMYLPQNGMDKLGKLMDDVNDITAWEGSDDINKDRMVDGYAYFESTDCFYKKKKSKVLLLQLLNPSFAGKVRVFHDPGAKEGGGIGIQGLQLTEDYDKSYYVKIGDTPAYKMKKKEYEDQASELFAACPTFYKSVKNELSWKKLGETLYNYSQECK